MTADILYAIFVCMKKTQNSSYKQQANIDNLINLLSAKELIEKKKRINLYLSEAVVKLIDSLAVDKSRGELITQLILKEAKKEQKTPYGVFSGVDITEEDFKEVEQQLEKAVNEIL